jgi:hypothetical protein
MKNTISVLKIPAAREWLHEDTSEARKAGGVSKNNQRTI